LARLSIACMQCCGSKSGFHFDADQDPICLFFCSLPAFDFYAVPDP